MSHRKTLLICLFFTSFFGLKSQKVLILGTAQDAGYPHIGCQKNCCKMARDSGRHEPVTSMAVLDETRKKWYLFEATPDLPAQLDFFQKMTDSAYPYLPAAIFVTHAHIGHYTGLMYLGKEAMNTKKLPVFCLPKMGAFLRKNGPWSQLDSLENITLIDLKEGQEWLLDGGFAVTAFRVPHRDEFSETAAFSIQAGGRKLLFLPDIDKWDKWKKYGHSLKEEIEKHDLLFLDATFYKEGELPGRNMKEIPHPFVQETMAALVSEPLKSRKKICLIHFNHSNPLLWDPAAVSLVERAGFSVMKTGRWL